MGQEAVLIDGQAYIEYSVLHDFVNKRFYWDANENFTVVYIAAGKCCCKHRK